MSDKIICFGKNYQDHMHELGDKAVDRPVIFLKPLSVLKSCGQWGDALSLSFPEEEIHYECELAFKLKSGGYQLSREKASEALGWYTIGLDMTKRILQSELKKAGHPWTIGKVFPDAAIIGPWLPIENLDQHLSIEFSFSVNNEIRQKDFGKNMLFSPIDLIVLASQYFPLCEGDIIFTGTPSGVGKINKNDRAKLRLENRFYEVEWSTAIHGNAHEARTRA